MAGIRQFDEGLALEGAMNAFWRHGFNGTSYPDLMAATGLSKSSLYNSFGDKQALYQRCLDRFAQIHGEKLRQCLGAKRLKDAIGGFFDELLDRFQRPGLPDGCMMTAAALELGGADDGAGACIRKQMQDLENLFRKRLGQAVKDGELPRNTDIRSLASFLLALTRGFAALHRGYGDLRAITRARRTLLQILRSPPLKPATAAHDPEGRTAAA